MLCNADSVRNYHCKRMSGFSLDECERVADSQSKAAFDQFGVKETLFALCEQRKPRMSFLYQRIGQQYGERNYA